LSPEPSKAEQQASHQSNQQPRNQNPGTRTKQPAEHPAAAQQEQKPQQEQPTSTVSATVLTSFFSAPGGPRLAIGSPALY